jgi:peptidoglycan/xylan/chitin deacetylase (PgdA/CDA1 family)
MVLASEFGQIVPLREIVRRHQQGRSTKGMIAVTFDDAYESLVSLNTDLLLREQIPITIFAAAETAANAARFWWDRIEDLHSRISADRWRRFEDACGVPETYRKGQPVGFGPLRPLRQWILKAYRGRWPAELEPALQELEQETGIRTAHRSMNFEELERLATCPWVDVGVHTVSHPVLPLLSDAELIHEIRGCQRLLSDRLGDVVPVLAVPFGLFDDRTIRLAREAGMSASLTLAGCTLRRQTSAEALSRFCVGEWTSPARLLLQLAGLRERLGKGGRVGRLSYPAMPSETT